MQNTIFADYTLYSASSTLGLILVAALAISSTAFAPPPRSAIFTLTSTLWYRSRTHDDDDSKGQWNIPEEAQESETPPFGKFTFPNPLAEISDMLSNFDDVVDDFYNKRVSKLSDVCTYAPSGAYYTLRFMLSHSNLLLV